MAIQEEKVYITQKKWAGQIAAAHESQKRADRGPPDPIGSAANVMTPKLLR